MQTHRLKHWPFVQSPQFPRVALFFAALGGVFIGIIFLVWSVSLSADTVAAGVKIAETELSGKTPGELSTIFQTEIEPAPNNVIKVVFEEKSWQNNTVSLGRSLDTATMTQEALAIGRTGSWWQQLQERWHTRWFEKKITPSWVFDPASTDAWIRSIAQDIDVAGRQPNVKLKGSQILINDGERGLKLLQDQLAAELSRRASTQQNETLASTVEVTIQPLTPDARLLTERRAEKLKTLQLSLVADPTERTSLISPAELFTWLTWPDGLNTATLEASLVEKTNHWNREPINAEFVLEPNAKKLTTFVPHRLGRMLNREMLKKDIAQAILLHEQSTQVPPQPTVVAATFAESAPATTLADLNALGIKERIAVGTSEFKGSIPNRIYNVGITAERVHGMLIRPGEEFSFNESVGEISGKTGYKAAYVIMNGRTQLGDGGGVCQVSTTIFRAALNGGLPITRWKAHSYRVGYYEQGTPAGFDATVYAPSVDFRFKNDTPNSLVVAAYPDTANQFLKIELWGTSDGRSSEISDYRIWNQRSAPAASFIPDPNLPAGRRQQIDWAAAGANTSFRYTVKDAVGSTLHEREFVSIFRPWQAIYLVGTGN